MIPRWRVRLRYRDGRPLPTLDRLATAEWMTAVLPEQADIDPVCVLPVNGGWTVSLHPREPDAAEALKTAIAAVCEVVGDPGRVLGQLVGSDVTPLQE